MKLIIEKGVSYVVVQMRPWHAGNQPSSVEVKPPYLGSPLTLKIGKAGELMFTERICATERNRLYDYDRIVKVFAPRAWLSYEYKLEGDDRE